MSMYASSSFVGISLWLVPRAVAPTAAAAATSAASAVASSTAAAPVDSGLLLADIIRERAEAGGYPSFPPHATLVAGLQPPGGADDVLKGTRALLPTLRHHLGTSAGGRAHVDAVDAGNMFFKCVYCRLELTEALRACHKAAISEAAFHLDPASEAASPEYHPHVSLVYGHMTQEEREAAAAEIRPRAEGIDVDFGRLEVWSTQGEVGDWFLVEGFDLTASHTGAADAGEGAGAGAAGLGAGSAGSAGGTGAAGRGADAGPR